MTDPTQTTALPPKDNPGPRIQAAALAGDLFAVVLDHVVGVEIHPWVFPNRLSDKLRCNVKRERSFVVGNVPILGNSPYLDGVPNQQ